MKKAFNVLLFLIFISSLVACNKANTRTNTKVSNNSIFHSQNLDSKEPISTTFDVSLKKGDTEMLYINLNKDTDAVLRYTYTTENKDDVLLGMRSNSRDVASFSLEPATVEAYNVIWLEEDISLKSGENTFYLQGDERNCKMTMEIKGIEKDLITYTGISPDQ